MDMLEKFMGLIGSYPTYARVLLAASLILFVGTALIVPRMQQGGEGNQAKTVFGAAIQSKVDGPKLKAAAAMDEAGFVAYFKDHGFGFVTSHKLWFDFMVPPHKFDIALVFNEIPNAPDFLFLIDFLDPRQINKTVLNERWAAVSSVLNSENGIKVMRGRFGAKYAQNIIYVQFVGKREQNSADLLQEIREMNMGATDKRGQLTDEDVSWNVMRRVYTTELLIEGFRL